MSAFGWSYPAGCSSTPFDGPCYCDVCGRSDTDCICPECPVCGEVGRPDCYDDHGMTRSAEQIASLAEATSELPGSGRARLENEMLSTWKTGQAVSGTYLGRPFTGTLADSRPTPDCRNMIFTVALDAPLTIFGAVRTRVEIHTNGEGDTIN